MYFQLLPPRNRLKIPQAKDIYMVHDPWVGQMLGKYRIEDKLGESYSNKTYQALHVDLDKTVIIKLISPELIQKYGDQFLQMLFNNAESASQIHHPNALHIYDNGMVGDYFYLIVQYAAGQNISNIIAQAGNIEISDALYVVKETAKALSAGHERGLLHLDIKPSNIFITHDEEVKISEFGLAMPIENASSIYGNKILFGTPFYLSPEQIYGNIKIDQRSDLYSLGMTLFYMLAGTLPFQGNTAQVLSQHVNEELPSVRLFNTAIPVPISEFIAQLTKKDPNNRYSSAKEIESIIDELLGDDNRGQDIPPEIEDFLLNKIAQSAEDRMYIQDMLEAIAGTQKKKMFLKKLKSLWKKL